MSDSTRRVPSPENRLDSLRLTKHDEKTSHSSWLNGRRRCFDDGTANIQRLQSELDAAVAAQADCAADIESLERVWEYVEVLFAECIQSLSEQWARHELEPVKPIEQREAARFLHASSSIDVSFPATEEKAEDLAERVADYVAIIFLKNNVPARQWHRRRPENTEDGNPDSSENQAVVWQVGVNVSWPLD